MSDGRIEQGSEVTVVAYGGEHIRKRVWQDTGSGVLLCSDAAYRAALETGREPLYSGFPKSDVIEVSPGSDGG